MIYLQVMGRFTICKGNEHENHYIILDAEEQMVVAWANGLRDAKKVKADIERLVFEDKIVDEAMSKLFNET